MLSRLHGNLIVQWTVLQNIVNSDPFCDAGTGGVCSGFPLCRGGIWEILGLGNSHSQTPQNLKYSDSFLNLFFFKKIKHLKMKLLEIIFEPKW